MRLALASAVVVSFALLSVPACSGGGATPECVDCPPEDGSVESSPDGPEPLSVNFNPHFRQTTSCPNWLSRTL